VVNWAALLEDFRYIFVGATDETVHVLTLKLVGELHELRWPGQLIFEVNVMKGEASPP
jgi:hypothetical protein